MLIYHKYIAKNLFQSTMLLCFIITTVIWITQSSRFLNLIIISGISFSNFIYLTFLLIPPILFLTIPIAYYISVIYTYNKLYTQSELIIFFSAGMNKFQISKPALKFGIWLTIINYTISLYFMPVANYEFQQIKKFYKENHMSLLIQEGVFSHPIDNLTFYIKEKSSNNLFKGIFINDMRNTNSDVTIVAKTGKFIHKNNKKFLYLTEGTRQEIDKQDNYQVLYFNTLEIDLDLHLSSTRNKKSLAISEMHINQLLNPNANNFDTIFINKMKAEAHNRIIWPIVTILFTMLAVDGILGGEFNRIGKRKRIFSTSLVLIAIIILIVGTNNLGGKYPNLVTIQYIVLFAMHYFLRKKLMY